MPPFWTRPGGGPEPILHRMTSALLALLRLSCACVLALAAPAWAAPAGLVTIVDGSEPTLLRGTQRLAVAEGVRLQPEDIVRTGDGTRLVRLELNDGTTLDLGPATELLLQPAALPAARAGLAYLLRGWLKVGAAESAGIATPLGDVTRVAGTAVLRVQPQALLVFAESGRCELGRESLRDGDAWVRRDTAPGNVQKRPPADLLDGLPRAFADPLPRRSARFASATVTPVATATLAAPDATAWLNAEPALRAALLPRWERTLYPEKFRPRPVVVVAARPPAPASTPAPVAAPAPVIDLHGVMSWPTVDRPVLSLPDEDVR